MERKPILLTLLARAYAEEKAFVAGLTEDQRARVGTLEQWSAKDVIAHNTAWKGRLAENLLAVSQGQAPQRTEDYDQENEMLYKEYHAKSWEEVEGLAEEAHQALMERVEELGEETLGSCELFPWQGDRPLWRMIIGNAYNHPLIHIAEHFRNQGESRRSGELIGEMARSSADLDSDPSWQGGVRYNLACHHSLLGRKEKAIEELREALRLNPDLEDWSKQDPDLEPIRGEPGYQAIYGG